uniref:Uncharacterized protein n=1 Tax=Glossina austeni TaxID=7395 RepID=A0A1A9UX41_GLOAU
MKSVQLLDFMCDWFAKQIFLSTLLVILCVLSQLASRALLPTLPTIPFFARPGATLYADSVGIFISRDNFFFLEELSFGNCSSHILQSAEFHLEQQIRSLATKVYENRPHYLDYYHHLMYLVSVQKNTAPAVWWSKSIVPKDMFALALK